MALIMIVVALVVVLAAFAGFMLHRNERVYRYKTAMLEQIGQLSEVDVRSGRDWCWRYEAFNSVSYERMLFTFWKSLDSFYPNKSFLN